MTIEPRAGHEPGVFEEEIRTAVRYERGLVTKALGVLVVLAVIVVLRTLYFALPTIRVKGACRDDSTENGAAVEVDRGGRGRAGARGRSVRRRADRGG